MSTRVKTVEEIAKLLEKHLGCKPVAQEDKLDKLLHRIRVVEERLTTIERRASRWGCMDVVDAVKSCRDRLHAIARRVLEKKVKKLLGAISESIEACRRGDRNACCNLGLLLPDAEKVVEAEHHIASRLSRLLPEAASTLSEYLVRHALGVLEKLYEEAYQVITGKKPWSREVFEHLVRLYEDSMGVFQASKELVLLYNLDTRPDFGALEALQKRVEEELGFAEKLLDQLSWGPEAVTANIYEGLRRRVETREVVVKPLEVPITLEYDKVFEACLGKPLPVFHRIYDVAKMLSSSDWNLFSTPLGEFTWRKGLEFDETRWFVRFLGEGGWSVVYAARPFEEKNLVVFKVPKRFRSVVEGGTSVSPEEAKEYMRIVRRVSEEAKTLMEFEHPHVLRLLGYSRLRPLLIYEFADGATLQKQVEKGLEIDPQTLIVFGIQVAHALDAIHSRGFAHFDLKPSNIFIVSGVAKIGDFSTLTNILSTGEPGEIPPGSIGWRAPEQVSKRLLERVRSRGVLKLAKIDVFQLANILVYMVTGRHIDPGLYIDEKGEIDVEAMGKAVSELLDDIKSYLGRWYEGQKLEIVASRLTRLLREMLHTQPEYRPTSEEVAKRLAEIHQVLAS